MSKEEELDLLDKERAARSNVIRENFRKEHPNHKGYGAGEIPELLKLRDEFEIKYFAIQDKYKKD